MSDILIYKAKDGHIELDVSLADETVWLSLNQLADLFGRNKSSISRHLSNIFNTGELDKKAVVAKNATTAADGKSYQVEYFNLDAIISVGYRVNSAEATQFRIWATSVLKDHLIKGYSIHEKRLATQGVNELQQSIDLLQKTLVNNELISDVGRETIQLILSYSKTWQLLLAYDEDNLDLPKNVAKNTTLSLAYKTAASAIKTLKDDLANRGEATELFGRERGEGLQSLLGSIEQTFGGEPLYKTVEEKAAHVLYFVIKDHPFSDGNKRIGCLLFLLYLKLQNHALRINDNGLVALALLVAASDPKQKDLMIRLIVNLLTK